MPSVSDPGYRLVAAAVAEGVAGDRAARPVRGDDGAGRSRAARRPVLLRGVPAAQAPGSGAARLAALAAERRTHGVLRGAAPARRRRSPTLAAAFGGDRRGRGLPGADQDARAGAPRAARPSWPSLGDAARCAARSRRGGRRRGADRGRAGAGELAARGRRRGRHPGGPRKEAIAAVARELGVPKRDGLRRGCRLPADPPCSNAETGKRRSLGWICERAERAHDRRGWRDATAGRSGAEPAVSGEHILTAVAWPYANGPRHIGHVAGFGVPSDVFSRYQRMAGNNVLMVSGTDEHGTPIQVQADAEGVSAARARRPYNRVIAGTCRSSGSPTTCSPARRPAPLRVVQETVPRPARQRLRVRPDRARRDQPVHRTHAARPLHRGHLPDLRLPARPRRPVRQLRQPARPDRPHRAASRRSTARRRSSSRPSSTSSTCPPSPTCSATGCASSTHWRPNVQKFSPQPARRPQAAGDHPRPRLGRPGAARRLARPHRQAHLRLVRRGHRLPVGVHRVGAAHRRPGRLAAVVAGPRRAAATTSWARTTSSSTPRSGRRCCSATPGIGAKGGTPGELGALNRPYEVVSSEFLTMEGKQVLVLARRGDLRRRHARPATTPTRCATSWPSPGRRTRTPTSPGPSSSAATTTNWSPAGATWSTARSR